MSELEMTNEAETEDFTDELFDEAIDQAAGRICAPCGCGRPLPD